MKIVVNKCFGGASLSNEAAKKLNMDKYRFFRTDSKLIKMVEEDSEAVSGSSAKLRVVEVPDEATDWELNEYDGIESITYVVDGKIHHV